jgi:hypothetical protein
MSAQQQIGWMGPPRCWRHDDADGRQGRTAAGATLLVEHRQFVGHHIGNGFGRLAPLIQEIRVHEMSIPRTAGDRQSSSARR